MSCLVGSWSLVKKETWSSDALSVVLGTFGLSWGFYTVCWHDLKPILGVPEWGVSVMRYVTFMGRSTVERTVGGYCRTGYSLGWSGVTACQGDWSEWCPLWLDLLFLGYQTCLQLLSTLGLLSPLRECCRMVSVPFSTCTGQCSG